MTPEFYRHEIELKHGRFTDIEVHRGLDDFVNDLPNLRRNRQWSQSNSSLLSRASNRLRDSIKKSVSSVNVIQQLFNVNGDKMNHIDMNVLTDGDHYS